MKIAFYAPMNAPDDGRCSGDRMIAQQIMEGLKELGHEVVLASHLKTWASEPEALAGFQEQAATEIAALSEQKFDAWFTYHLYYKAPDLIGPAVSAAMGIPYFVAEASHSPSRLKGPWSTHTKLAKEAIRQAAHLFSTCPRDLPALKAAGIEAITPLRPWIDPEDWETKHAAHDGGLRLATTAMMREGDKLESYRILSLALEELEFPWSLTIAGDGPTQKKVEILTSEFGPRINFVGKLDHKFLKMTYAGADAFVWPGINEGLGMVYLEAMAAGVPVVAVDGPGVRGVLNEDVAVLTSDAPEDFAAGITSLLDTKQRKKFSRAARDHVEDEHSKDQFICTLKDGLQAGGVS